MTDEEEELLIYSCPVSCVGGRNFQAFFGIEPAGSNDDFGIVEGMRFSSVVGIDVGLDHDGCSCQHRTCRKS